MKNVLKDVSLVIEECRDVTLYLSIAELFARSADHTYVSHSELKYGFATADGEWAEDYQGSMLRRLKRLLGSENFNDESDSSEYGFCRKPASYLPIQASSR
jgi:hypothetical protein